MQAKLEWNPTQHVAARPPTIGNTVLAVAAAASVASLVLANNMAEPEPWPMHPAPAFGTSPDPQPDALDKGLDWSRVEAAPDTPGLAIAAYER
jgi:hypothetical protein